MTVVNVLCYNRKAMVTESLLKNARIIQSFRRSIGFEVVEDGTLVLRVPYGISSQELLRIVAKKEKWIAGAQTRVRREREEHHTLRLQDGETFLLFGRPCTLRLRPGTGFSYRKEEGLLEMGDQETRENLARFLIGQLRPVLGELVSRYASQMGLRLPVVKCSRAKKRWGYCNWKGEIGFSWPLVFCPREVIAYVVVHELCHIRNMSHNKAFWQAVAQVLPDYRERENWLKVHRKVMSTL